jgi:phage-related protein
MDTATSISIKLMIDDKAFQKGLHKIEESLKNLGEIHLRLDDKQFSKEAKQLGKSFSPLNSSIKKIGENIKDVSKAFSPITKTVNAMKQSVAGVGKQFETMISKMNQAKSGLDKMKDEDDKQAKKDDTSKDKGDDTDKKSGLAKIFSGLGAVLKGFWGIIVSIAKETDSFKIIIKILEPIVKTLSQVINKLLEPVLPLIKVLSDALIPVITFLGNLLGTVLTPIIKALFPYIQKFGIALIEGAKGIGAAWNSLLSFLPGIFRALANFEIFGMKPFKGLENAAKGLEKMKIDLSALDKIPKSLTSSYDQVNSYVKKNYKIEKPADEGNTVSSVFKDLEGVFNQIAVKQQVFNLSDLDVLQAKYDALLRAIEEATGAKDANTEAGMKELKQRYLDLQQLGAEINNLNAMNQSGSPEPELSYDNFVSFFKSMTENIKKVSQGLGDFGDALLSIKDKVINNLAARMPVLNSAMQGAQMGGAAAGPWGAIIGAIIGIMMESKTFGSILKMTNSILQVFADALGSILEPFLPIIQILNDVLAPVFKLIGTILGQILTPILQALFPVFKLLGLVITGVALVFAKAWNAVASAINWALGWLGVHVNSIDESGLQEAWDELINMTWEEAMAKAQETEATKEATEALRNVPEGFKIALTRFSVAQGQMIPGFASGGFVPYTPGGRIVRVGENPPGEWIMNPSQMGGGGVTINFNAPVYGVDDFKRTVLTTVNEARKSSGMAAYGVAGF